jgi:hypothetical protein
VRRVDTNHPAAAFAASDLPFTNLFRADERDRKKTKPASKNNAVS